mgnify:CR=1 FL=1|tara:strand:+ start:62 stop:514 length:453 start_codon:yes stop_codon:yes gene_type:complete
MKSEAVDFQNVHFTGLFIPRRSREHAISNNKIQNQYQNIFYDHVTLHYRPGEDDLRTVTRHAGLVVPITVRGIIRTPEVLAYLISLPNRLMDFLGIRVDESFLHITLATAEGVPPVKSNEYIRKGEWEPYALRRPLVGVLGYAMFNKEKI